MASIFDAFGRTPRRPTMPEIVDTSSGGPQTGAPTVLPVAGDNTPLLDSGIHLYQPKDIGSQKWTSRFRRFLNLQAGQGIQDYPGALIPAVILNAFNIEDYYSEDILMIALASQAQVVGAITDLAIGNPATSQSLLIVDLIVAARLNTVGAINIKVAATATITAALGAAVATTTPRDERAGVGAAAGRGQVFAGSGAVVGTTVGVDFSGISVNPARIVQGFVLIPGQGLVLQTDIIDEGMTACFNWRERSVT